LKVELALFDSARKEFPAALDQLFFNTASKGPLPTSASLVLADFNETMLTAGEDKAAWLAKVEETRALVARLLACGSDEVAFCRNTSDGLNIAANAIAWKVGDNVVVPVRDHPNNVYPWLNLRSRGVEVRLARTDKDWIDADTVAPYMDSRTRVVAVSHVSSHPGQRNDLAGMAAACERFGAHLVVDAVQSLGILNVNVEDLGISILASGCQKGLLTPHGLGVLYCRRDLIPHLTPVYAARSSVSNHQPRKYSDRGIDFRLDAARFEYGNHNYAGVYALDAALGLILSLGTVAIEEYVMGLGSYLDETFAGIGLKALGPSAAERQSSIREFALAGAGWAPYLRSHRVAVSYFPDTVRVSLHFFNSRGDIDELAAIVRSRLDGTPT